MSENKGVYKTSRNRDKNGQCPLPQGIWREKKLRSMMLSDHAWDTLKKLGDEKGASRTDIIEEFTRQQKSEQEIVVRALKNFIEMERESFGAKPSQKGKEFSLDTRTWDAFRKFLKLADISPRQLGLDE
ncbi:hypothetical protein [Scytonema sp. PRP1]|uniref:hypothetical protein n=1 Tax=Scytonema sp. PRP1 TaxID=3120513 RepID=UPI00300CD6B0